MSSMFVHVIACIRISFLRLNNSGGTHISHFVFPFSGHVGCFLLLTVVNNTMNMGVQKFFLIFYNKF